MKNQLNLFFIIFLLGVSLNTSFSQNDSGFLSKKKGVAFFNDGTPFPFKSVKEKENTFIFKISNKETVEFNKNEIAQIEKQNGNHAFKYGLISAGTSGLVVFSIYAIRGASNSSSFEGEEIPLAISSIGIVVGVIGALVGLTQKKYKTIYHTPTFGKIPSTLKLKTTSPNSISSIGISYTF